jgi:hypothetical protein
MAVPSTLVSKEFRDIGREGVNTVRGAIYWYGRKMLHRGVIDMGTEQLLEYHVAISRFIMLLEETFVT